MSPALGKTLQHNMENQIKWEIKWESLTLTKGTREIFAHKYTVVSMLLHKENQIRSTNEQEQVHIYSLQLTEHCFCVCLPVSHKPLCLCAKSYSE